mmetsp:Transcript_68290/g.184504  ORF Transcript_68290/g.184504 Transcript_68290/m.184504 type:complete len:256 (+) Transcript_68290:279-1046(+)
MVLAGHVGVPGLPGPQDARVLGLAVCAGHVQGYQRGPLCLERHERALRVQRPRGDLPPRRCPPSRRHGREGRRGAPRPAQHVRLLRAPRDLRRPRQARGGRQAVRAHPVLFHRLPQVRGHLDGRQLREVGAPAGFHRDGRRAGRGGPVPGRGGRRGLLQAPRGRDGDPLVPAGRPRLPVPAESRPPGDAAPGTLRLRRGHHAACQELPAAPVQDAAAVVHPVPGVRLGGQASCAATLLGLPGGRDDAERRGRRGE